jgi:hypothetical protein
VLSRTGGDEALEIASKRSMKISASIVATLRSADLHFGRRSAAGGSSLAGELVGLGHGPQRLNERFAQR